MVQALKRKEIGLLLAGVAALALSGCADSSRIDDHFSSPFKASASRYDRSPTGSTLPPSKYAEPGESKGFFSEAFRTFDDPPRNDSAADLRHTAAPTPVAPLPMASRPLAPAPIVSQPLPAPRLASPAPIQASPVQAQAPAAPRVVSGRVGGWSAEGGVPVVVAQGETAGAIANRYGVPVDTLLQVNGYRSAAQVQPGARLTIPVYSANARAEAPRPLAAPQVARPAEPVAPAAKKPEPRLVMKPGPKSLVQEENEDAAKPAAPAKAKPDPVAERKAKIAEARAAAIKEAAVTIEKKKAQEAQAAAEVKKTADAAKAEKLAQKAQAKAQQQAQAAPAEEVKPAKAKVAEAAPEAAKPKQQAADDPTPARITPDGDSANPEFRWPARGRVIGGYGGGGADGINIAVPEGTAVKAAEAGEVTYAGSELKGYGNLVLIHHPNGFDSVYANNSALNVKRGDKVKRGQTIAVSGQSGNVSSPQLHFELRKGHKPVDPTNFLAGL
jgi:murein DD-endopeptidase MepM/ murein hydrolase activator NlpD